MAVLTGHTGHITSVQFSPCLDEDQRLAVETLSPSLSSSLCTGCWPQQQKMDLSISGSGTLKLAPSSKPCVATPTIPPSLSPSPSQHHANQVHGEEQSWRPDPLLCLQSRSLCPHSIPPLTLIDLATQEASILPLVALTRSLECTAAFLGFPLSLPRSPDTWSEFSGSGVNMRFCLTLSGPNYDHPVLPPHRQVCTIIYRFPK